MHYPNIITNAIEVVLGWDLPDEAFPEAFKSQVMFESGLMAGGFPD